MKKHDWVFRRATIPDFDQMARFLRSGRRSSDRTYFLWKLMKNPFHEGFANIADLNGKVIGGNSICPKVIAIKGNFVRGAELCDVFKVF